MLLNILSKGKKSLVVNTHFTLLRNVKRVCIHESFLKTFRLLSFLVKTSDCPHLQRIECKPSVSHVFPGPS